MYVYDIISMERLEYVYGGLRVYTVFLIKSAYLWTTRFGFNAFDFLKCCFWHLV